MLATRTHALREDGGRRKTAQALLRLALTAGDERLAPDPQSGRNQYGVPPGMAVDEVWFASSTASAISARGYEAATTRLDGLLSAPGAAFTWPDIIRRRLTDLFGIPGTEVVLTGSGTAAELVVLALARTLLSRPVTNIVVAPSETGSGVCLAAEGRHFLSSSCFETSVSRGSLIGGFEEWPACSEGIAIRDRSGAPIDPALVDEAVAGSAERAIGAGRDALLHCLDASKTGLAGLQRSAAADIQARLGDRCLVVVDACQLRCRPEQIRRDLASGFLVIITGSKFAGGPPFSGAVLVPPALSERLGRLNLPAGLRAYSAVRDWPARFMHATRGFAAEANSGLYLRWEAALAEIESYGAIAPDLRGTIAVRFAALVEGLVRKAPELQLLARPSSSEPPTIFAVMTSRRDGTPIDAHGLRSALARPRIGFDRVHEVFHVGQPVQVGPQSVLRVCLSAPLVVDTAERLQKTGCLTEAMSPLAQDLEALFAKWSRLAEGGSR